MGRDLLDQSQLHTRGNTYWLINYRMPIRLALPLGVGAVTYALNKQPHHSAIISSNNKHLQQDQIDRCPTTCSLKPGLELSLNVTPVEPTSPCSGSLQGRRHRGDMFFLGPFAKTLLCTRHCKTQTLPMVYRIEEMRLSLKS